MAKQYFGFALADSMFFSSCTMIRREVLTPEHVRELANAEELTSCCNSSHSATIAAMRERFGIEISIPEKPPSISLCLRDSIIIMGVRGLPRLTDRHEYTPAEIAGATFQFTRYTVAEDW